MASVNYRLPWPPSINAYWATGTSSKHGVPMTYLTHRAKQFRVDVWAVVWQQHNGPPKKLTGRLAVLIELSAGTKRKYDIDNFCKGTLDALMHAGVFEDDELIDELIVRRLPVKPPGCCDVTVCEV